ncbi:pyridine nucleotide-disulfide oxidoreductase [Prochlorococcus marinus str. MU1404]|uniref:NAD(P)/FAD-dependent oxidoreductase n=1 Tax=Prochlorococcus marinus TaxID=1219 RepID=UPI001ADCCF75|nr:FAD-dependent oxidoreductase [Prochlorococcus marinus]MBO8229251.1 FAD-dependent oxidoreductase [Prochlorococcus marinus XMU1404]MBW3072335.1 pyridine nucleotide-disulfide oxidoreductase [Prochlorococcus marinus str. MU1404]MCR8544566.1 FAD-dependent oxidoreductase [Prochlorococcus marinus CUG1432]
MESIQKPIVIVGAGFAGMTVALNLKNLNPSLPILVVDSVSNFIFKPLMYEVLSKEIRIWEAAPKFANIFSDAGITFLKNCLIKISFEDNILEFSDQLKLSYQYLVICTGSIPNSFSIKGIEENCYFFNDLNDLNKLKIFLKNYQKNPSQQKLFIVGGGPSGIELACKIKDIYIDQFEITIVEKSNEILHRNKIFNREESERALEKRKITVLLNSKVEEVSVNKISISSQDRINSFDKDIVIWTAGVKPNLSYLETNQITKKYERILVNNKLQIENYNNCFAIGDISIIEGMEDLPITAQVAMQEGNHLAKNIELLIRGKNPLPFEFQDNGEMISLGIGEASISALGLTLSGKLAFEVRRLIYASKLPDITESLKSASSWLFQKKTIFKKFLKKNNFN